MSRKIFTFLLALFCASAAFCAQPPAQTPEGFAQALGRNRYLEAELSLATKPGFYVVVDLSRKEILLKARGAIFRTWPIVGYQQIGDEVPVEVLSLLRRSYASEALRVRIKPPEGEGKDEELIPSQTKMKIAELAKKKPDDPAAPQNVTAPKWDAMELKDMPTEYFLTFAKDVQINVTAEEEEEVRGLGKKWDKLVKKAKDAYALYQKRKTPGVGVTIDLNLKPIDAKAFYWALGDSMNLIFRAEP